MTIERTFFLMGLAILLTVLMITLVWGASPDVCRPYARDLTQTMIKYLWDRAYTTCLNSDEDPIVPDTWQDGYGVVFENKPPIPVSRPPDIDKIGVVPAMGPSGFATGSDEWVKWCKDNYRTFRVKDGTVVRRGNKKRVPCPG